MAVTNFFGSNGNSVMQESTNKETVQGLRKKVIYLVVWEVFGGLFFAYLALNSFLENSNRRKIAVFSSEAQIALEEIYHGEKAFYTEYAMYVSSLELIGYSAAPTSSLRRHRNYAVGFPTACSNHASLPPSFRNIPEVRLYRESDFAAHGREQEIIDFFRNVRSPTDCKDPKIGFEAYAVGIFQKSGPLDVWRIDEKKNLERISPMKKPSEERRLWYSHHPNLSFLFDLIWNFFLFGPCFFYYIFIGRKKEEFSLEERDIARFATKLYYISLPFLLIWSFGGGYG